MLQKIKEQLLLPNTITVFYILIAIVASIQSILVGTHNSEGHIYTDYNNYIIFKNSFFHFINGKNLYCLYLNEQWDLYKYSPTFALFMAPLTYLPDLVGLSVWNIINALVLLWGIRQMPFQTRTQSLLLWFVLLESLTSLQNAQSNGLMAGLMIAAFGHLQQKKNRWAALWIVIATFIKVYGAVGLCLFLFYPDKIKSSLYVIGWSVLIFVLPLIVITPQHLLWQYQNWASMMAADQSASLGLSVMGWLHGWFGLNKGKSLVSIVGIILFLLPLIRWKQYSNLAYRLLFLASMLIWVIIFNHKAESPTFIIAVAGAGTWFFSQPRALWKDILIIVLFIFTCLSPTDIFPPIVKDQFFKPYAIKVVPCIILWCVITLQLLFVKEYKIEE